MCCSVKKYLVPGYHRLAVLAHPAEIEPVLVAVYVGDAAHVLDGTREDKDGGVGSVQSGPGSLCRKRNNIQ
jgi:hypothetical protein